MRPEAWSPLSKEDDRAQRAGVLGLLAPGSRVLDLGAGAGRLARPLARAGHRVLAIDSDPRAIKELATIGGGVEALAQDFLDASWAPPERPFDAVLCLGHTFMQAHDPHVALRLLGSLGRCLTPGGPFVIDDIPGTLWREVAEGNWQEGVSEDGSMQLVWHESDNVIALREGDDVDETCWRVRETDVPMRLWSMGELELLAMAGAWGRPRRRPEDRLIVFTRPGG